MKITITHARANLRALWDKIERTKKPVIIQRRGHADMALLPAAELARFQDVALAPFLELLANDIGEHPERLRGFPSELLTRIKALTARVPIDHDAPIGEVETFCEEQFKRMQDPKAWAKTKRAFKADLGQGRPAPRNPRKRPRKGNA